MTTKPPSTTTCKACKRVAHRMFIAGPKGETVLCGNCAQKAMDEFIERLIGQWGRLE